MCICVPGLSSVMAGQLIERGKNTWFVRIYLGRGADGKRQYLSKTIHGTKKQAQTWLNKTLTERDAGVAIKPAQQTLGEYLDHWLESAAKPRVRPKTFAGYSDMLDRHIRPTLGLRPLSKLTPLEIQRAFHAMAERGLSARSIEYTRMILKQALKQAISWRLMVFNPCEGVQIPRQERREMQALAPDQARKFLAVVRGTQHGALFELALTTGLRPSEYCALKWDDINFERGTLSVVRSIDFQPGGGWLLEETKTRGSRRVVRLLPSVLHALAGHRLRQEEDRKNAGDDWRDEGFVFTNEKGSPVDRHNLANRHFKKILTEAGLPPIRLYDLRHTAATLSLAAGVPVKVVSEMLGHSGVALTLDVYSHVLPHMQEEAVQRVAALLEGENGIEWPEQTVSTQTAKRHTRGTQRKTQKNQLVM